MATVKKIIVAAVVTVSVGGIAFSQEKVSEAKIVKETPAVTTAPILQSDATVSNAKVMPPIGGESATYTLGKGDIVEITVRNNPEFSGKFVVGPDGNIQYTFMGDIKAEGLTKTALRDKITQQLEKFIKIPEVDVTMDAYLSKFVYILGEVGRPGKYPMQGDTVMLRDLLAGAGLPTREAALRRVIVVKPDVKTPSYRKVDIYTLLYKGVLKDDLVLQPGEVVVVPSTVPAEINRALSVLLDPFKKAADARDLKTTLSAK